MQTGPLRQNDTTCVSVRQERTYLSDHKTYQTTDDEEISVEDLYLESRERLDLS